MDTDEKQRPQNHKQFLNGQILVSENMQPPQLGRLFLLLVAAAT